jgi:hypothetical protein
MLPNTCKDDRILQKKRILEELSEKLPYRACSLCTQAGRYKGIVASSMDSDLEAFSHNPAGGSFPTMAFPPVGDTRDLK